MDGEDVILRPVRDRDGDGIAEIVGWIFAQYPNCPFDRKREFPELDAIAGAMAERRGAMWIAEDSGRVVGCFGIVPTSAPHVFELYKVYLLPEARGRGIARKMLALALDFARQGGADSVRLWTDTRFVEGHIFYRRNGFQQVPVIRYLADLGQSWEYAFTVSLIPERTQDRSRPDGKR